MVEERLNLEPEVQEIFEIIDNGQNFLLSGGAGSGKTYSLVSVIRQVISENPTEKVACMTYTNAAVKEIEERVNHKNLNVSTIHDFFWDNIKHFQKELKQIIIELANDENVSQINISKSFVSENYFSDLEIDIQYREYTSVKQGIISHDELLIIANKIFEKYPKLGRIVKNKYKFIFIDEYQDTSRYVVEIFLNHFKNSEGKNIIGFFGDAMQSIYDDGIGNLDDYKGDEPDKVKEVQKVQNRRNPRLVIDLANKLRTDRIIQEPSTDHNAPNMNDGGIKRGNVLFISSQDNNLENIRTYLRENYEWNFGDTEETKELNLTHSLIAQEAGFKNLMDIYDKDKIIEFKGRIKKYIADKNIIDDFTERTFGEVIEFLQKDKNSKELKAVSPTPTMKDFIDENIELFNYAKSLDYHSFSKLYIDKEQLLDEKKRDDLIKHLFKIQNIIYLYNSKRCNEFIKATDYRFQIRNIKDKQELKSKIESLIDVGDKTIEEIIEDADNMGICKIDDKLIQFKTNKNYVYNRVKNVPFQEFQKLYEYSEERTPFSTQHKTKGSEYNNVLVILDNANWNKYNFEQMFLESEPGNVLSRTQKLFYVCCTRAKENLAVFFHNPSENVITKAKEWFGSENVILI